jgi:outer membrane lipoprotein-sorting protein
MVAGLLVAGAARAEDPDAAKQLIEKALKAHGGLDILKQPRGYTYKVGAPRSLDAPSTTTHYFQPPHMYRLEQESPKYGRQQKYVQVVNGDEGWSAADGLVKDLSPRTVQGAGYEVRSFGYQFILKLTDPAAKSTALGTSKEDGQAVEGLELTQPSSGTTHVYRLFFDARTHLLARSEHVVYGSRGDKLNGPSTITWQDYKTVGGIAVPHRVTYVTGGRQPTTYLRVYSDFKFVDKLDPKLFEKPPEKP